LDHGLGVFVVAVVVTLVLGAEALAGQPRLAGLGDAGDEALDVLGVRDDATEGEAVVGAAGVDAVEEEAAGARSAPAGEPGLQKPAAGARRRPGL